MIYYGRRYNKDCIILLKFQYKCKIITFYNFRKTQNVLHVTLQRERERVSAVKLRTKRKKDPKSLVGEGKQFKPKKKALFGTYIGCIQKTMAMKYGDNNRFE